MAIKKYHVSKNLWDEVYTNISTTIQYKPIYVGEGNFTLSTTTPYDLSVANLFLLSGNVSSGAASNTNGVWLGQNRTVTADNGYITVAYRVWNNTTSPANCQTMLNTGSTALPYEPYGDSFKDWFYRKYGTETETLTSLPADVIADGQSATANIIGNMVQTGTPSPSSIIMPQECGDKTANLCSGTANINKTVNSVTVTSDALGNFTVTGVADSGGGRTQKISDNISLSAGTYRVSLGQTITAQLCVSNASGNTFINSFYNSGSFTLNADATVYFGLNFTSGNSYNDTFTIMLQPFSTDYPYQPYGYKIPILSGNVTTPVYLGEVQSTRQIYRFVLTGTENVTRLASDSSNLYLITPPYNPYYRNTATGLISNSYVPRYNNNDTSCYFSNATPSRIVTVDNRYTTADDFKNYCAQQYSSGNPVIFWYVLATPTTTTLNEPIRKIGDYADSVSVSNLPTTGTAEQFDVDTTLKPSEVSLTYHGWHEHSDTKFT